MSYPVYYSDLRAKFLSDKHSAIRSGLISLLGEESYVDGALNRVYVSECIFSNPNLRLKVNEVIHPIVRKDFDDWAAQQTSTLIFNEAAILFETGATEVLVCDWDSIVSNGIKFRSNSQNESGSTYIYMAFADKSFGNINGTAR